MIKIYSFSFIYSDIPQAEKRHALHYVFDCRPIKNPGRIEALQIKTGMDTEVIEYLEQETEIKAFIESAKTIIDIAVREYLEKQDRYEDVSIYFGCTGGRHRSVYSAEALGVHIREQYDHPVQVEHLRLNAIKE